MRSAMCLVISHFRKNKHLRILCTCMLTYVFMIKKKNVTLVTEDGGWNEKKRNN